MNILTIQKKYNTQKKCIAYLEKLRWGKNPVCVFCNAINITKRKGTYVYHCNSCNKDFTVLINTIFEDTRLPLPTWFQIIGLMLNARKGIASLEISRNYGLSYKTAWYVQMRVRCAMIDPKMELEGILEMDEAFIGGKPRKKYIEKEGKAVLSEVTSTRGRGTKKTPFVAIVEKSGKVTTKVMNKLSSRNLLAMLKRYVKIDESAVITDAFRSYQAFDDIIDHITLTEKQKLIRKGMLNLSTIDSFFSIIKKGVKGTYVVISKKYLPFYLIEFQYKFNERNNEKGAFEDLLKNAVSEEKCLIYYKPVKQVRSIVHPKKPEKKIIRVRKKQVTA